MPPKITSSELLADYFVSYLFTNYQGSRHVRRIASWVGFVIKAVERLPRAQLSRSRSRQFTFTYRNRRFKVRYNHGLGSRGGIQIVEVLPGRGAPEGNIAVDITSLSDAEDVYNALRTRLDAFVAATPTI